MQQGDDFTTPAASEQPAVPVPPTTPANQFVPADQPASAVPPVRAMPVANQTAPVMPPVSQPVSATGGLAAEMPPRNHNSSRRVSLKIVLLLSIIVLVVAVCGFIYVLADKFGVFRGVSQKSGY